MKRRARASLLLALLGCGARTDLDLAGGETGPGEPEVCNGRDDDLDGLVDEGLGERVCGVGACRVTAPACLEGVSQTCAPKPPSAEICNGLDDDCDGTVDEHLGFELRSGPHLVDAQLTYVAYGMIVPDTSGFALAYGTGFDGSAPMPNALLFEIDLPNQPAGFKDAQLAAGSSSFLLLAHDEAGSAFRVRFDDEGNLLDGPTRIDGITQLSFAAEAQGNYVAAGTLGEDLFATRLDETGDLGVFWRSDEAPELAGHAFAFPMVAAGGGSVVAGYAELNAGAHLEVIELGCVE